MSRLISTADLNTAGGVKTNATAAAPGAANDNTQGYTAGSIWLNTATSQAYICRAATTAAAAAVWTMLDTTEHPGYISGNWYVPLNSNATTSSVLVTGQLRISHFTIKSRLTISQLGARIITPSASGNIQLGIYAINPANGQAIGNPICTTGNISTTSAALLAAALSGGNVTLEPGIYGWACNSDNSVVACLGDTASLPTTGALVGSATQSNVAPGGSNLGLIHFYSQTFGAWPNLTGITPGEGAAAPVLPMRKAA